MSQIETIMLMTLGFAVAALIALFIGRLVWQTALKLGRKRVERQAPSTMAEIRADRDRLKAEFAMLSRKMDMRLDDMKTRLAEQTAEVSRNRNRVKQLADEVENRDRIIAERETTIAELRQHYLPLEQELATRTQALREVKEDLRDREDELLTLRDSLAQSTTVTPPQGEDAASFHDAGGETTAAGSGAVKAQNRLRLRIAELNNLSGQIEDQRQELARQHSAFSSLKDEMSEAKAGANGKKRKPAKPKGASSKPTDKDRVDMLDAGSRSLEKQLLEAEAETAQLETELKDLDAMWNAKLKEIGIGTSARAEREKLQSADVKVIDSVPVDTEKPSKPARSAKPSQKKPAQTKTTTKAKKAQPAKTSRAKAKKAAKSSTGATSGNGKAANTRTGAGSSRKSGNGSDNKKDDAQNVISLVSRIRSLQNTNPN